MILLSCNGVLSRYIVMIVLFCFSMNITVSAAMLSTAQTLSESMDQIIPHSKTLSTAQQYRQSLRQQLIAYGVATDDVQLRVNSMTNSEVIALASEIEDLPAGSDALTVIAFVFLVLLFTDIAGYTDLFPFVKKTTQTQSKTHDGQVIDRRKNRTRQQPIVIEN